MDIVKAANLALTFLLELTMLAAYGYWGFSTASSLPLQIALGIGAPVVVAVIWGFLLAPKAKRRLGPPLHQVLEVVLFGLSFLALYLAGQPTLAILFAVVYAINFGLRLVWKQYAVVDPA